MNYRIVECDLGAFVLFARRNSLSRLDLRAGDTDEIRTQLALEFPDCAEAPQLFNGVEGLLRRYARGDRVEFDVPVDLADLKPFTRLVLTDIRRIPYGKVASYGMIAKRLGRPFASRAVGQALKRNPIPIVVPCHRVVRGDGTLGGFDMGPDMKMRLLSLEGIRLDDLERSMIQT
jgi:methylated-DNA-[protein]-cysteine S-methyltransferase